MISEEARQRFETFESLFQHPGWKLYQEDLKANMDALQAQWRHVIDARALHIAQGRYDGLSQAVNFDQFVESLRARAEEEAA